MFDDDDGDFAFAFTLSFAFTFTLAGLAFAFAFTFAGFSFAFAGFSFTFAFAGEDHLDGATTAADEGDDSEQEQRGAQRSVHIARIGRALSSCKSFAASPDGDSGGRAKGVDVDERV